MESASEAQKLLGHLEAEQLPVEGLQGKTLDSCLFPGCSGTEADSNTGSCHVKEEEEGEGGSASFGRVPQQLRSDRFGGN